VALRNPAFQVSNLLVGPILDPVRVVEPTQDSPAYRLRTQIPLAGTIKLAPGIDVALVAKLFHKA
jgi:hypothetical protein